MELKHKQEKESGVFLLEENGEPRAEMTYDIGPEKEIIINHTQVDEDLRGKDLGQQLVKAAVEHARNKKIKIIPLCTFAKAVLESSDEYSDVLDFEAS